MTPSAFYLVLQLTLVLWLLAHDRRWTSSHRLGLATAMAATAVAVAPFVETIHPADVIHDLFTAETVPAGLQISYESNRVVLVRDTPCAADVTNDGLVTVSDLLEVILNWGAALDDTAADIDGNGQVDVLDLIEVIVAWGVCV